MLNFMRGEGQGETALAMEKEQNIAMYCQWSLIDGAILNLPLPCLFEGQPKISQGEIYLECLGSLVQSRWQLEATSP